MANLKNQADKTKGGSDSLEIAGPARIAPILSFLSHLTEPEIVKVAIEQTVLTHHSIEAKESVTFLTQASYRLMHGAGLEDTLNQTAPVWALNAAKSMLSQKPVDAIAKLGHGCSISSALPSVLFLGIKHGDDTETAFIENAMAGGDNCARGLALGMILGTANGQSSIPEHWINELNSAKSLYQLLEVASC